MAEMAHPREHHGHAQPVGGRDYFRIVNRPAGLDERRGAVRDRFFDSIGKGKKASDATTVPASGSTAFMAPILTESTRLIWPAPTPTAWPARA